MKWKQKREKGKIGERIQGGNDQLLIDFFRRIETNSNCENRLQNYKKIILIFYFLR